MDLTTQLAVGTALLISASVLAHFFYVAMKSPEEMHLGLASELPKSWGGRIYLGIVVLSWLAFAFSGAYGLLSWLPGEGALTLAGLAAVMSLGLLTHVERSAYILTGYRRILKVRKELEQLVKYATIPSQGTIEGFQEKAKSAETGEERDAYRELARLAAALAERDTKLCEYAVSQAQREASEQADAKEKANKTAKAHAARRELQGNLRDALNATASSTPVGKTIDAANAGAEALLEPTVAKQKWQALYDFGERLRRLGQDAPILTLLQAVAGAQPIADTSFEMVFSGTERDGHYDVFSVRQGIKASLAEGLAFEPSLDGLVAAFFLRAALPGRLAWGHGFYDRDQEFIFSQDRMVAILENDRVSPDSEGLRAVAAPPGLRYSREEDGTLTLRCLAYRPGKGFYDYSVSIAGGVASSIQETKLYQWGQGVFY